MRGHRKLALATEKLLELGGDELRQVNGGTVLSRKIECDPSDWIAACDSLLRPCITYTCTR